MIGFALFFAYRETTIRPFGSLFLEEGLIGGGLRAHFKIVAAGDTGIARC